MEIITTSDLIQEIRDQTNEYNEVAKNDDAIMRMINRGLRFVVSQLARDYQEPLLAPRATLNTTTYNRAVGIEMPKDAFENRVLQVWVATPTAPLKLEERTYRQIAAYEYDQFVPVPNFFYIRGRNIVTVPPMQGTYNLLVDYIRAMDKLVKPLGRVSAWDVDNGWIVCRDLDTTVVTTQPDDLASFVNVIDGRTGSVVSTLQVQTIEGNRVTFRTTPTYTEVYGRTVSTSIADLELTADFYLCPADGTCVPQFGLAFVGYLVEYGAACVKRSLNDAELQITESIKKKAEEAAALQKAGRTSTLRVKNNSKVWGGISYLRFPFSRG